MPRFVHAIDATEPLRNNYGSRCSRRQASKAGRAAASRAARSAPAQESSSYGADSRGQDAHLLLTMTCPGCRSDTVRLVGADKEMLGVMSLDAALDLADEQELDVIVISPDADPPVCRLVSYDKFKYEEEKAKKVQSKKQREGRCAAATARIPLGRAATARVPVPSLLQDSIKLPKVLLHLYSTLLRQQNIGCEFRRVCFICVGFQLPPVVCRVELKELKIRPNTDVHDYQVRLRSAAKFISKVGMVQLRTHHL